MQSEYLACRSNGATTSHKALTFPFTYMTLHKEFVAETFLSFLLLPKLYYAMGLKSCAFSSIERAQNLITG